MSLYSSSCVTLVFFFCSHFLFVMLLLCLLLCLSLWHRPPSGCCRFTAASSSNDRRLSLRCNFVEQHPAVRRRRKNGRRLSSALRFLHLSYYLGVGCRSRKVMVVDGLNDVDWVDCIVVDELGSFGWDDATCGCTVLLIGVCQFFSNMFVFSIYVCLTSHSSEPV